MMRKRLLLMITLCIASSIFSFSQAAGAAAQAQTQFGTSAIWAPSQQVLQSAHTACDNAGSGKVANCFVEQMAKAGAPNDAVGFTRALYSSTGQFGTLGAIKEYGPVALAWVVFPLRANSNDALLIVNGNPPFIDLDNVQELDKEALKKDPLFLQWKATAPQLDVWPADRSAGAPLVEYARVWPGPKPGDLQFVYSYPLINGCAACAHSGFANYLWSFDSKGDFLGTKLLSVTRGAPPLKKSGYSPAQTQPVSPAR